MLSIKDLFTKLIKSTRILPNYYNPNRDPDAVDDPSEKHLTSLNIEPDNSGSARLMLVPNSMPYTTESGKSPKNGYVLHFNWDEGKNFASQLFLGHNKGAELAHRNYVNGWTPWHTISYYPVEIPANANLNSYTDCGEYFCPEDARARNLTNCPTSGAFRMTVDYGINPFEIRDAQYRYRIQTITDCLGRQWYRTIYWNHSTSSWVFDSYGWIPSGHTRDTRQHKFTSGSVTVEKAQTYNICSLTFPAYSGSWLILSNTSSKSGSNFEMMNNIQVTSGTAAEAISHVTRVTTSSGQGVSNWMFLSVSSSAVTVTLQCYGYNTTKHTEQGIMVAVRL